MTMFADKLVEIANKSFLNKTLKRREISPAEFKRDVRMLQEWMNNLFDNTIGMQTKIPTDLILDLMEWNINSDGCGHVTYDFKFEARIYAD